MRKLCGLVCVMIVSQALYAGDIAHFVNLGFSADGSKFAFGQYGLQDKTYRAYADIYAVDVRNNTFLQRGIFKTSPSKLTAGKESKITFLSLQNRAQAAFNQWGISEDNQGRLLYSQTENTIGNTTLFFRDFQTNEQYTLVLHTKKISEITGCFHITIDKIKPNGTKVSKQIGKPDYVRSGVKQYAVKKIIVDNSGHNLVCVIEKTETGNSGDSYRYMVETVYME